MERPTTKRFPGPYDGRNSGLSTPRKMSKNKADHDFCEGALEDDILEQFIRSPSVHNAVNFQPTEEEFQDPFEYLRKIESIAGPRGICTITPPKAFSHGPLSIEAILERSQDHQFSVVSQMLCQPPWPTLNEIMRTETQEKLTSDEFVKLSLRMSKLFGLDALEVSGDCRNDVLETIETEYWRIALGCPTSTSCLKRCQQSSTEAGSLFLPTDRISQTRWNPQTLWQEPDALSKHLESDVCDMFVPKTTIGCTLGSEMWRREPVDTLGLQFLHGGAPRMFYACPPFYSDAIDKLIIRQVLNKAMGKLFHNGCSWAQASRRARAVLSGNSAMILPKRITDEGIPVTRVIHRPGDIMVIFPRSYHMSFSFGFNCHESVNLAPIHWYEHGASALHHSRLLHRAPRIPLEEMLCKEAILVGLRISNGHTPTATNIAVLRAFLSFVDKKKLLHQKLLKRGVRTGILDGDSKSGRCSLCGSWNFLSLVAVDDSMIMCTPCALEQNLSLSQDVVMYGKSILADLDSLCLHLEDSVKTHAQSSYLPASSYKIHPPPGYWNTPECAFLLAENVRIKCLDRLCSGRLFVNPLAPEKGYVPAVEAIRAMGLDMDVCEQAVASLWMEVNRASQKSGMASLPPFPMKAFCKGNGKGNDWEGVVFSHSEMSILLKTVKGKAYIGLSLFVNGLQPRVLLPPTM